MATKSKAQSTPAGPSSNPLKKDSPQESIRDNRFPTSFNQRSEKTQPNASWMREAGAGRRSRARKKKIAEPASTTSAGHHGIGACGANEGRRPRPRKIKANGTSVSPSHWMVRIQVSGLKGSNEGSRARRSQPANMAACIAKKVKTSGEAQLT